MSVLLSGCQILGFSACCCFSFSLIFILNQENPKYMSLCNCLGHNFSFPKNFSLLLQSLTPSPFNIWDAGKDEERKNVVFISYQRSGCYEDVTSWQGQGGDPAVQNESLHMALIGDFLWRRQVAFFLRSLNILWLNLTDELLSKEKGLPGLQNRLHWRTMNDTLQWRAVNGLQHV